MTATSRKEIENLLRRIWGYWNIHAIVVASLGFQCTLEFLAPLRKRRKKGFIIHITIWSAYLLADYFATFGIALINSNADDDTPDTQSSLFIQAFWAPFLLLHLGGPHAITSFDIEDNNLWHRQLLTLVVQTFSVFLVFGRYSRHFNSHRCLIFPSAIVFFAGIVKYAERTHSLFLASVSHTRRSMLHTSSSSSRLSARERAISHIVVHESCWKEPAGETLKLNDDKLEIIHRGYMYYQLFKGFILDHALIHIEEDKLEAVKKLFLTLDPKTAYKVLEVELNFMYDSMFTKMAAVQWISPFGYAYRFVVHALLVAMVITFYFCHKSDDISKLHKSITYILMGGAVVLDLVALWKLVCSEWTVALMMEKEKENKERKNNNNLMKRRISRVMRDRRIMRGINAVYTWVSSSKRWSKEIRQYSLINHYSSVKRRWQRRFDKIINTSGFIRERFDAWQYTTIEPVGPHLLNRVFEAIKNKAAPPQPEEEEELAGGGEGRVSTDTVDHHYKEYDNCVLIWHVATEICYFTAGQPAEEEEEENKKLCRNISEYLMYFLVMEGKLTSTVPGNIGLRFKDMCWEEVRDTIDELVDRWENFNLEGVCKWLLKEFGDSKNGTTTKTRTAESSDHANNKLGDSKNGTSKTHHHPKSRLSEAVKLANHLKSCCKQDPKGTTNNDNNNNNHNNFRCRNPACNNQIEQDVENPPSKDPKRPDKVEDHGSEEKELWEILSHVWIVAVVWSQPLQRRYSVSEQRWRASYVCPPFDASFWPHTSVHR